MNNGIVTFRKLSEKEIKACKAMPTGLTVDSNIIRSVAFDGKVKWILEIGPDGISRKTVHIKP